MPKKKKLYIVRKEFDGFGGAENVAKRFLAGFESFFDVSLIYAGSELEGHTFSGVHGPGWFRSLSFASSVNKFLSHRSDALVFSMTRGVPGTIFRMGDGVHECWLRRKRSGIVKRISNPNHLITPILERSTIAKSKYVIPNSSLILKELEQFYPEHSNKFKVIHNGYNQDVFKYANLSERELLKAHYKLSNNNYNLLFCANGWERKGLTHVLELLSKLTETAPAHLWVAGRGDQLSYHKRIEGLGVSNHVTFLGSIPDTHSWYQMADLFILPTLYDPFSNSCLEALASGCPVLTTQSNGASECFNEKNGLSVNSPRDVLQDGVMQWSKNVKNLNRKIISDSVKSLTSVNEINSYLNLLQNCGH
jgi:UDP-glucose:(heptosyl)LPS alpha-1,3-glucosyltransferase